MDRRAHFSAAGLFGYGFEEYSSLGIAARLGYSLSSRVYVGALFQYHFGDSDDASIGIQTTESRRNIYYFGVEGGYEFHLSRWIIRPYAGLGPGFDHRSIETRGIVSGEESDSDGDIAFWFGSCAVHDIDGQWFIGGDFRLPFFAGDAYPTFQVTGGLSF